MVFIPEKYKIADEKDPETGTVEIKCSICNTAHAVPPDVVKDLGPVPVCENPGCKEAYEKAQAQLAAANLKNNSGDPTKDTGTMSDKTQNK